MVVNSALVPCFSRPCAIRFTPWRMHPWIIRKFVTNATSLICVHRRITKLRKRSSILAIGLWEHTLAWFDLISPKGRTSRRRRRIPWRIPKRCFQHDLTKNERRLSLFFESGEISRRRSDFLSCSFDNSFLLYPISLYFDVTQKFSDCLWNRGFLTNCYLLFGSGFSYIYIFL